MSVVAFGNIPPFFSSFPYGPVPSSGVASTKFVDLFNAQTIAGAKTFSDDVAVAGGDINLTNATSNRVNFGTAGSAPPAFTTRSAGTRVLLYDLLSGTNTDAAIGYDAVHMWFSNHNTSYGFRWYGGTTLAATLSGVGQMTLVGGATLGLRLDLKSYTVGTLPAAGTAGGTIYVSDAAVAPCVAFSNGTNWKRCDNAATTVV